MRDMCIIVATLVATVTAENPLQILTDRRLFDQFFPVQICTTLTFTCHQVSGCKFEEEEITTPENSHACHGNEVRSYVYV